jgi:hypothetical protein
VAAALIVWLIWLGRRKRDYGSKVGTVQGWTSAHVYLGTALIIVATLHTGFQFGWNLHTLAYTLMMIVILSGFFGIWAYARYPSRMTENTGGKSRPELYTEVAELDRQLQRLAEKGGRGQRRGAHGGGRKLACPAETRRSLRSPAAR